MKRVLTAAVLIPVVLLLVFRAPLWLFATVIAAIAMLALHEYLDIVEAYGIAPIRRLTYAVALLLIAVLLIQNQPRLLMQVPALAWWIRLLPILISAPIIFGIPVVFRHEMRMAFPASACSALGVIYIALSLGMLIPLRHSLDGKFLVIFILLSVWCGDTAAYYVGRSLGRHKLAPVVSPKKTWEGALASVIASVAVAAIVFHFWHFLNGLFIQEAAAYVPLSQSSENLPWSNVIVMGVITNVAAQFGDLFESVLKRGAQVKDSGTLLPGHGGILDRIDALLFAIPVVWYYATLSGLLQEATYYHP